MTRSTATLRAIRNNPSSPSSRSWPNTVANNAAASVTLAVRSRPSQHAQTRERVLGPESISSSRAPASSQSICGLAELRVVIDAAAAPPATRLRGRRRPPRSSARIAERIKVIVSMVATASYNGVESNTRLAPTRPAARAASTVTSKIRLGRLRRGPDGPACRPAPCARTPGNRNPARRRRTSSGRRTRNASTASRSDSPNRRCSTITTATIMRRDAAPTVAANRSANISSGKRR